MSVATLWLFARCTPSSNFEHWIPEQRAIRYFGISSLCFFVVVLIFYCHTLLLVLGWNWWAMPTTKATRRRRWLKIKSHSATIGESILGLGVWSRRLCTVHDEPNMCERVWILSRSSFQNNGIGDAGAMGKGGQSVLEQFWRDLENGANDFRALMERYSGVYFVYFWLKWFGGHYMES